MKNQYKRENIEITIEVKLDKKKHYEKEEKNIILFFLKMK
jgi:hypothetical protein